MASRKRKSKRNEFQLQTNMTPVSTQTPRRSARLTQKYGSGTTYPYYITSRPWISSYKDTANSVLNESGQSVPSTFDSTIASMDDVIHDHTYSKEHHSYIIPGRDFILSDPVPLATSSSPHLFGLDISDTEEPEIPSSSDFNIHIKERTLTPRKQEEINDAYSVMNLILFVVRFFYRIGSCLYLLINLIFCCDVAILQKSSQLFRSQYGSRSLIGLLMLLGTFFLVAFCLIVPHLSFPSVPIPPPNPSTTTVTQTLLPSPVPGNDNFELINTLREDLLKLRKDHEDFAIEIKTTLLEKYKFFEELLKSEKESHNKSMEGLRLIQNDSISNIYKDLNALSAEIDRKLIELSDNEQQNRQRFVDNMNGTLNTEVSNLRDKLIKLIESSQMGNTEGVSESQVKDIAQRLIDDASVELKKLISDSTLENDRKFHEMTKTRNSLENLSIEMKKNLNDLEAQFLSLSNEAISNKIPDDLRMLNDSLQKEIQQLSDDLKELDITINNLKVSIEKTKFVEGGIGEDFVWKAISIALYNYSADQIARFDFALESAGGRVSETSTSYDPSQSRAKIFGFTLPITLSRNTPNAVIQPSVLPGNCWCFEGTQGYILIKLASTVLVDAVTLQHIPKVLSPNIQSAPKLFKIWGKKSPADVGVLLGEYEYDLDSNPIQTFETTNQQLPLDYINFQFITNYGNPSYTCIYRIRVHGSLPKQH